MTASHQRQFDIAFEKWQTGINIYTCKLQGHYTELRMAGILRFIHYNENRALMFLPDSFLQEIEKLKLELQAKH